MPQATNLVVKNNAGTDKTFTLMTPAAGDGGLALWYLKDGPVTAAFPVITMSANKTGDQRRRVTVKTKIPSVYTNASGQPVIGRPFDANLSVTVPDDFPEADKDDAVAYVTNLLNTTLIKSCLRDGYSAT